MKSTICCDKCGKECECQEDGVDCPECDGFFCDNCYDFGLREGCRCHNRTEAGKLTSDSH